MTMSTKDYVGAFLPAHLKRALLERARRADRTASAELRVALRKHLGLPEIEREKTEGSPR